MRSISSPQVLSIQSDKESLSPFLSITIYFYPPMKKGKTGIILPIEEYENLLEDLHDLAMIAERRDEPTIPSEVLKKRLKNDGIV
jgi:hypothetical protein